MFIQDNEPLKAHSTMRLGGKAAHLSEAKEYEDVAKLAAWAKEHELPILVIGDGSNIVWRDEGFPGLVVVNRLMGFETSSAEADSLYFTVGAGENWDSVVERSVAMGYSGIAELSLIPGTAGATPVQNVGAYGKEISDVLVTVEGYDLLTQQFVTIPASECSFGYRTSRFKTMDKGRFFITAVTLLLSRHQPQPPYYESVQQYFDRHGISSATVKDVRQAVVEIRGAKLPDVKTVANTGSFFGNPIIKQELFARLLASNPQIKSWPTEDGQIKLSAAWLIEQAGFKDAHDPETGMATWPGQSLVLINEYAKSTADLLRFKQKIVDAVQAKFGIALEQEPELLP